MRLGFWPTPHPLDQSVVEPILDLYFRECFSVPSPSLWLLNNHREGLDVRCPCLSCSIREPKEGRGPREEDRAPALGVGDPHPAADVVAPAACFSVR